MKDVTKFYDPLPPYQRPTSRNWCQISGQDNHS